MPLPTCQCNAGLPVQQQLSNIYCALVAILAAQGGGNITLSQISDMSAFWKNANAQTPAASTYLTSNGAGVFAAVPFANISITASQVSDSTVGGRGLLTVPTPAGTRMFSIDAGGNISSQDNGQVGTFLANGNTPFSGLVSPITNGTWENGIATNVG